MSTPLVRLENPGLDRHKVLYDLFNNAYGNTYRGDYALKKKLCEASFALISTVDGHLSAGCVVDRYRITAIGTTLISDIAQPRFGRMVDFLQRSGDEEGVGWMSIGLRYNRMQEAASSAGMHPIDNPDRVRDLLHTTGELGRYNIISNSDGPTLITKMGGYDQNIWTWPS